MSRGLGWQPPAEGFTPEEVERFWSFVDRRDDGHMVWNHITPSNQWFFSFRGRNVTPNRIAWALANPGLAIPIRLFRKPSCPSQWCVNANCWDVRPEVPEPKQRKREKRMPEPFAFDHPAEYGAKPAALGEPGLSVPPILEAYAALQFGIPVKPRPMVFKGRDVEEVPRLTETEQLAETLQHLGEEQWLDTTFRASVDDSNARTAKCVHCGETIHEHQLGGLHCPANPKPLLVEVHAPVGAAVMNPTPQDMDAAGRSEWNDPIKLLEFIFRPGTCVMTFQDHVWFWNEKVRVDAPDGPRALVSALTLMGLRRTAE